MNKLIFNKDISNTRFDPVILVIAMFLGSALSGCGEPYRREAKLYVEAVQYALIEKGICTTPDDCHSRKLVFWNDGEYFFDVWSKDVTFVNLYSTQDPSVVEAVVNELRKTREKVSTPGVVLNVFKSRHLEPEVKLQRIVIK